MIVKVQRPIAPPDGDWLIYDKTREWLYHGPPSKQMQQALGRDMKAYFLIDRWESGETTLLRRVPEEEW